MKNYIFLTLIILMVTGCSTPSLKSKALEKPRSTLGDWNNNNPNVGYCPISSMDKFHRDLFYQSRESK